MRLVFSNKNLRCWGGTGSLILQGPGHVVRGPCVVEVVLGVLALLALAARQRLSLTLNGRWDEYHFLHFVHDAASGVLSGQLQTFHVHLFSWLPVMGGLGLDQILAARQVVFALQLVGALALWRLGA
jgi:hypothetical protein